MTISVFHSAKGQIGYWAGPHPCSERKRISAVDLSGSIERKTAVAAGHCAGFAGLQPLAMPELAALALRRTCTGNGDVGDCCWSLSVVDVAIILGRVIHRRWQ